MLRALFMPWRSRHLSTRIVAVFLMLLLLVQASCFVAIQMSITRNARASISADLEVGERALLHLLSQNASHLLDSATLLAADYGFREALASGDNATVVSALSNHGERIDAFVSAFLDTSFQLKATTRPGVGGMQAVIEHLAARARANEQPTVVELVDGLPAQFVLVPMKAPVLVGWVMIGFRLDQRLANDLHSISGLDLVMLSRAAGAGGTWHPAVSTLSPDVAQQLEPQLETRLPTTGSLFAGANEYSLRKLSLNPRTTGEGAVEALLLRSVDEALAPYRQLQWVLGLLTLLGVIAFAVGSVITARKVTTPIRRLASAAERLSSGDYTTPISGVRRGDEIGELAQRFEHMRTSIASHQDEILQLAYWDRLTGLPNRLQFRDAVQRAIAKRGGASLAIVMLDLDRFKHVNEVLGYRCGDLLLKGVAERLGIHTLRDDDMVARLGADEFAVLLPGADAETAQAIALRIASTFEAPLVLEEHTVDLGAGIGIACWPEHATDADTLLSRAEVAMTAAKRRAQGPTMYSADIDSGSAQTLSLLSELRHAIEHNELRLHLQPKIGLSDGKVRGAEALVRWMHPTRGLVPPMEFIPFAEQTGFVRQLTLWVFEEAARHWNTLRDDGLDIRLSVNLSTRDLLDPELPEKLEQRLRKHGVPTSAFCLELTESAIMDDPARAEATLRRLNAFGFKLAIDDFGTGYSSLAYLKRLPVDELKIDKSFVLAMERDIDDAKIVRSTIDLAHNLGLTVVAEGVENQAVWLQLRGLNCDEAQGYHMSKPMPMESFIDWCHRWSSNSRTAIESKSAVLH